MSENFFRALIVVALVTVVSAAPATAQTCDVPSYKGCSDTALATCDNQHPDCEAVDVAVSLEDVQDEVVADCCSKNRRKQRNRCLKRKQRRYGQARGRSRGTAVRDFLRRAVQQIRDLRRNDCGVYQQLF